jgi:lipopolysaccharide/colanic/teichoic acid biosynthesis glycosyltransferase
MAAIGVAAQLEKTHESYTAVRPPAWRAIAVAERAAALVLLVLLSPILLIAAVLTVILSRDCPFVAHARVGRGGRPIRVIKLRTMWGTAPRSGRAWIEPLESTPVPLSKAAADPRVTSGFAAFCRRYSIDELPQLWQAVRGEMALVGPRPITRDELRDHYGRAAREVLSVAPGITGLWQVRGRSRLSYRQRRRLDLFLVRKWSPALYLSILAATTRAVLSGRNSA